MLKNTIQYNLKDCKALLEQLQSYLDVSKLLLYVGHDEKSHNKNF